MTYITGPYETLSEGNWLSDILNSDISHFIIQLMHNVKYVELIKTY